jgi:hypothetical protein
MSGILARGGRDRLADMSEERPGRSRLLCVVARAVLQADPDRPTRSARGHRQTLGTGGRRRGQHPPVSQRQTRARYTLAYAP